MIITYSLLHNMTKYYEYLLVSNELSYSRHQGNLASISMLFCTIQLLQVYSQSPVDNKSNIYISISWNSLLTQELYYCWVEVIQLSELMTYMVQIVHLCVTVFQWNYFGERIVTKNGDRIFFPTSYANMTWNIPQS